MALYKEKHAAVRRLRDTILHLCKASNFYQGRVEVDGIICISGQGEGQDLVVKLHDTFTSNDTGRYLENGRDFGGGIEEAQDLRKRRRLEDSAYDDASPEYSEMSMEHEYSNTDGDLDESGAKDLSLSHGAIVITPESGGNDSRSSPSPYSGLSPEGRPPQSFVGTSMFHSSNMPYYIPKRTPIKPERWSPNQPIPSAPECKQCGFNFDSFDILAEHNEAVHSVFTCNSCFKTFTSRSNLERHSRLHTGHKPYICTICNKAFSRKDHLSNHATKHAYKCGTCSKRFNDKKMLVTHYQFDHNAVLTNICDFCNKGFSSNESYEEHVKGHPQYHGDCAEPPSPQTPSPAFNRSMAHHSPGSTPVNLKRHSCNKCGFSSGDSLTLAKHSLIHADAHRCYTCLACAKMFEDPLHYSDHMLVHQNEVNVFECVICRQLCSTLQSLRRHEANHVSDYMEMDGGMATPSASLPSPAYPCHLCRRTFTSHHLLKEHMEIHQQQQAAQERRPTTQQFACPACNTDFDSYNTLVLHMEKEGHLPGHQGGATEQTNENRPQSGATEQTTENRNKRKQAQPKPLQLKIQPVQEAMDDEDDDEDEDSYEIVQPESPGNSPEETPKKMKTDENSNRYGNANAEGASVNMEGSEKCEENGLTPMKMDPVRSLFMNKKASPEEPESPNDTRSIASSSRGSPPMESNNNSILLPSNAAITTPTRPAAAAGPNNNAGSGAAGGPAGIPSTPSKASNIECPPGPYTCSVCSTVSPNFQDLEMHCFSEHNRSPCMFCSKTFAQKANRDRHVCLHTGEKPYACPECDEKFSRGDKLKLHRVRVHKVEFPVFNVRGQKEMSSNPSPSPAPSNESKDVPSFEGGIWAKEDVKMEETWRPFAITPNMSAYSGGHWSLAESPRSESPLNLGLKNNPDSRDGLEAEAKTAQA